MGVRAAGPVLVVEDDPSIRALLRDALEDEGLDVVSATDGADAIRIASGRRPALVVLDMGLPLLDGAGVAAAIRDQYGPSVPFVVVTASRHLEDAAAQIGAARYLAKPFDVPDLVRAVVDSLNARGAEVEAPSTQPAT